MFRYMREDTPDDWKIKKLQDAILEIAVYLDEFCSENEIDYCLMGGSALGAVRHQGFIPWDDDLDFFMTPDSYERFVHTFEARGDHKRFFLEPFGEIDGMITLGKVRLKNTTYLEEGLKDYDISHNIYLDIFLLHTCPDNSIQRIHQYIWAKYVVAKAQAYKETSRYGFGLRTVLCIMRIFPRRFLVRHALKQVYKYRGRRTSLYCNYLGKAKYRGGTYKRAWFAAVSRVPFEKVMLNVPIGVHEFLAERFGNYMKLPELAQIKREQHACLWDTEKDYRVYLNAAPKYPRKYVL